LGVTAKRKEVRRRFSYVMPVVVLAVFIAFTGVVAPSSLSPYGARVVASEASPILLLALGQTVVMLLGGIDLSNAALASLVSILLALFLPGLSFWAFPLTLILATAIGLLQGLIVSRAKVPSLVVTLCGMGLLSGLSFSLAEATVYITKGYDAVGWLWKNTYGIPISFILGCVLVGVGEVVLRMTPLGRRVYAVGNAELVALMSGINAGQVRVIVHGVCGFMAGLAGALMAARTHTGNPSIADNLLLPAIAAVVLGGTAVTGGTGSLASTLIGVVSITLFRMGMTVMGVDPGYEPVVYGIVLVAAIAITVDRSKLEVVK
jgi:ribose transport system permease protein